MRTDPSLTRLRAGFVILSAMFVVVGRPLCGAAFAQPAVDNDASKRNLAWVTPEIRAAGMRRPG